MWILSLRSRGSLAPTELEVKKNLPKDKSLQVLAFEEVARKMELKQQYEQLRNMINCFPTVK